MVSLSPCHMIGHVAGGWLFLFGLVAVGGSILFLILGKAFARPRWGKIALYDMVDREDEPGRFWLTLVTSAAMGGYAWYPLLGC